ncbi:MAG: tyrosine--tRNA ligase [Candidatus Vogelbacteria bacterium CG10_big_fil_rev_8_21_14_0_10_49_38]|uniref:Tyrosine--tRNA ligase n=1 Tax=Candidatus Vogelbacteria bacterium CG10_big_fil_rev_8_21_14_0_10_49_38 TaxID=1975043 RepID=A0A2H0RHC4_9BACT|nr:MAG: tyrosine--tRNA ligase [bacterium CG10_49_38]PIR45857.1 MAG: tyrosine--tRNA ligase [Candidatus Vogelbacteria bacterium CG10_big_fil_rev_8_21_14_0_10_49_38]
MTVDTDPTKIAELLARGVTEIIGRDELVAKLNSGQTLRVKLGIDPTSANLHLGRSIPLLKLRDFQDLGHQIIFVIGDFTGQIGDTSDKESERPMLTEAEVATNLTSYVEQVGKILDLERCEIRHNSEWLKQLTFAEIGRQADAFSVSDFIARDNIKRRLEAGKRVSLRETLYPLLQGYDSVEIRADVEVGGTDQRFNMLAGRELQRLYDQAPQSIITNPLIDGLDGRKMSSSWGNVIKITETAPEMYGQVMSLRDELIIPYFINTTRFDLDQIRQFESELVAGGNPKEIKMKLAHELVRFYHSAIAADQAQEYFVKTFSQKELPDRLPELKPSAYDLLTVLTEAGFAESKSDARRAIEQDGVRVNEAPVTDPKLVLNPGDIVQKGKRHFMKVI